MQYRYKTYFHPNKLIEYTPKDFSMLYEEINIGKLNGWLFPNKGKSEKILIFFHGNAGNISNRIHVIKILLEIFNETDIYIFDYPQFGLSCGKLEPSNIISSAYKVYDYWSSCYKYIGMIGESIGTGIMGETLDLLFRLKNKTPFILIHINGISALKHVVNNMMPLLIKPFIMPWIQEFNTEKIYIKHIEHLPKLIVIHANNDDIIPIKYITNMMTKLKLHPNKYFFKIDGSHNDPIIDETLSKKIKSIYSSFDP